MNVDLTPELERLVHLKVQTGQYMSANDVVGEALRQMEERDQAQVLHKPEIRDKIAAGVASLRAGNGTDGETFLAAMDVELAELERRASARRAIDYLWRRRATQPRSSNT